jgi:predicted dehydrogenase
MTSHVLSIAKFLVGDIAEVCAAMATFIQERPVAGSGSGHTARAAVGGAIRRVENDDMTHLLARFNNGAMGAIGSSRIGTGRKHALTIELQGTEGAIWFTLERLNELNLYRHTDPPGERGYKLIAANPGQPAYSHFHPIPGVTLTGNDSKLIEARAFIEAVRRARRPSPTSALAYTSSRSLTRSRNPQPSGAGFR